MTTRTYDVVNAPKLGPSAVTVSDRTCEAVLGVPWRPLRRWAQEHGIPIYKIGRRSVVPVEAVLRALGLADEPSRGAREAEPYDEAAVVADAAKRRPKPREITDLSRQRARAALRRVGVRLGPKPTGSER